MARTVITVVESWERSEHDSRVRVKRWVVGKDGDCNYLGDYDTPYSEIPSEIAEYGKTRDEEPPLLSTQKKAKTDIQNLIEIQWLMGGKLDRLLLILKELEGSVKKLDNRVEVLEQAKADPAYAKYANTSDWRPDQK
jgi:hypothetical protein